MNEFWVIITIAFFILCLLCVFFYLRYLVKVKRLDTLIKLAESGGEIKPEMVALLSQEGSAIRDLRKGLFAMALGIPIAIGCMVLDQPAMAAFGGGIPLLIGVAYLVVARVNHLIDRPHALDDK